MDADAIIALLGLAPHPEGGWYAETFRDTAGPDGRAHSSVIHFLLKAGENSAWHRVDAAEIWHWHGGAPLELGLSPDGATIETVRLGMDLAQGERPHHAISAGHWQKARSLGAWTLVSCTVAPGFTFEGFEMAPPGWAPGR